MIGPSGIHYGLVDENWFIDIGSNTTKILIAEKNSSSNATNFIPIEGYPFLADCFQNPPLKTLKLDRKRSIH